MPNPITLEELFRELLREKQNSCKDVHSTYHHLERAFPERFQAAPRDYKRQLMRVVECVNFHALRENPEVVGFYLDRFKDDNVTHT